MKKTLIHHEKALFDIWFHFYLDRSFCQFKCYIFSFFEKHVIWFSLAWVTAPHVSTPYADDNKSEMFKINDEIKLSKNEE